MKTDARAVSEAATVALEAVQGPVDIRLVWLGIEGRWRQTAFNQTLRTYLTQECQVPASALRSRQRGELPDGGAQEDAAADRAVQAAQTATVQVHTHLGLSKSPHRQSLAQEYARVATATGGLAFAASAAAPTDFVALLGAILGHRQTTLSTDFHKETPMATKDTPAPAPAETAPAATQQKSYLPTTQTGLQDYAYWWEYARKQAKKGKGVKDFRRGRIWT